ncbi:MAG: hypothetical protein JJ958_08210 [Balneola sp.]|nr:hypothetical protein [Balneola sp.]
MPIEIPDGYPNNLEDDILLAKIKEFQTEVAKVSRSKNYSKGSSYWKNVADIGQNELMLRLQRKQIKANKNSRITSYIINLASIAMLLTSLWIANDTRKLAEADQTSDENWRTEQLNTLLESNRLLQEVNTRFENIPIVFLSDSVEVN